MWQKNTTFGWAAVIATGLAISMTQAQPAAAQASAEDTQPAAAKKKPPKLYELRIYRTNPGKLPELNARFRDHTLKLFEKHGMENIIYWTLTEDFQPEPKDDSLVDNLAPKTQNRAHA